MKRQEGTGPGELTDDDNHAAAGGEHHSGWLGTCGGDPRAKVRTLEGGRRGRRRRAAGGSGGARRPSPAQGAVPGAGGGPSRFGGALRGPSPGDKGLAAPRSPGAARARALRARTGLGSYLGRPTLPGRRSCGSVRGGLFRGALRPSSRSGTSSSGSGRLSLRLPLRESPRRAGEVPGRGGGTGGGAASGSARAAEARPPQRRAGEGGPGVSGAGPDGGGVARACGRSHWLLGGAGPLDGGWDSREQGGVSRRGLPQSEGAGRPGRPGEEWPTKEAAA